MKHIIISCLLFSPILSSGQNKGNFLLHFEIQPELTYHKNDYAHRYREKYTKTTANVGVSSNVQYFLTDNLFISAGLGYIPRQLKTNVFLNQAAIPPPRQSFTLELNTTQSLSYRTLFLPASIGYIFLKKRKLNPLVICEFLGNYILNARYDVNFDKYDGTYKRNYWQGYSLNLGFGTDYKISKKIVATCRVLYSVINTVNADEYLFSQDKYVIPLPHKYLKLNLGIKIPL